MYEINTNLKKKWNLEEDNKLKEYVLSLENPLIHNNDYCVSVCKKYSPTERRALAWATGCKRIKYINLKVEIKL